VALLEKALIEIAGEASETTRVTGFRPTRIAAE
jgi:hypothetical protein